MVTSMSDTINTKEDLEKALADIGLEDVPVYLESSTKIQFLGDYVWLQVKRAEPKHEASFLAGLRYGAEMFAIWRDGVQYLGAGDNTLTDLKQALAMYMAGKVVTGAE